MPKAIRPNQEFFDVLAGDILARLYTHFPEPLDMHSEIDFSKIDAEEEPARLEQLWTSTVRWLAAEGFLRFELEVRSGVNGVHAVFHGAVLTVSGLRALKKVPPALGETSTYGEKLTDAAKDLGSEAGKKTISEIVGEVIGGVIKSVASG